MHSTIRSISTGVLCAVGVSAILAGGIAAAKMEFETVAVPQFGYQLKIPEPFEVQDKIDRTTSWLYQPGSAPAAEAPQRRGLGGVRVGPLRVPNLGGEGDSGSGGGLEPAVMIFVNWVWMPDVSAQVQYNANLKQVQDDIASPHPQYTDIQTFDKEKGYAWEGLAFWFKEVDKSDGEEIHRWHIKAFGNQSQYTIGLTGTYAQFEEWGPIYEEVIKSFELIPLVKE